MNHLAGETEQNQIFISYSHADRRWLKKLHTHLAPYVDSQKISIWDDTKIREGDWRKKIESAIATAKVAVLLVSPNYLSSEFIINNELPRLLESVRSTNLQIIWIAVSASSYRETEIDRYQAANDPSKPLDSLSRAKLNQELVKISELIGELAHSPEVHSPEASPRLARRSYFDHLIERHTRLFAGREVQCNDILEFIQKQSSGYIFIESLSGYGKTSLLAKLVQENPGFAYHFISQAYKTHGSDFDPTQMDSLVSNLCEQLETQTVGDKTGISPKARLHSLLRAAPRSGSRVIVIDAIDEIDKHPNYLLGLFPEKLPTGVFVILSARKLGDHKYLPEIGLDKVDKIIPLEGLDTKAITQLLTLAGGKAPSFASSEDFVMKLHSVSSGDPFYLRFLIEDVAQGSIRENNICDVPSKLDDYLDMQLSILDRSAHLPQQRDILGVILEA